MNVRVSGLLWRLSVLVALLAVAVPIPTLAQDASPATEAGGMTLVAGGLANPRGFAWDAAGVLHVAGAEGVSRYELARLVTAAHGGDPEALDRGLAADHPEPRPLDCRLDSSRAQAVVRTRLRGVSEVLGRAR